MQFITITADGNTLIYEGVQDPTGGRVVRQKMATTVLVTSNTDTATITFGTKSSAGLFVGFPDGVVTEGSVINHNSGVQLWVNVTGITSNPVEIGVSI